MNTRKDWCINANSISDIYYTKNEIISEAIENFDIRRYYSSEGYSITTLGLAPITDQVLIQDHFNPINQNKTEKKIHISINSLLDSGSQFAYKNETWMISSHLNIIDDAYKTGLMTKCNYNLKFQNSSGDILAYPAVISLIGGSLDNENKFVVTSKTKFDIKLPFDNETIKLREDKRFMIDFETTEPSCYKLIQRDVISGKNGDSGVVNLLVEACERETDDSISEMICNYFVPNQPMGLIPITYNANPELKNGGSFKTFIADTDEIVTWTLLGTDLQLLNITKEIDGNTIKLKALEESLLIGTTFKLKAETTDNNGILDINITSVI